jgi:hypothetical protein
VAVGSVGVVVAVGFPGVPGVVVVESSDAGSPLSVSVVVVGRSRAPLAS